MIIKRSFGFVSRANNKISHFDIFSKNGTQLSQIIRVASQKKYDDERFWSLIKTRLQYVCDTLSARNLSFIANGLSRAGIKEASDWECIVSRTYELSNNLSCQDIALLFNSMCKVDGLDRKIFSFLTDEIKKKYEDMGHRYAAMIIYSLGRLKLYDQSLMKILLKSIKENINKLSLISISSIINGFYQFNNYDLKVMILVIDPIKKYLKFNSTVESKLEDTSKSQSDKFIEVKTVVSIYQGYSHSGIYDKELYNMLFEYMMENSSKLKLIEMIIISNSMNTSKLHNEKLIEIINKKIIKKPKAYDYDGISMYLSGLMNYKYVPKGSIEKLIGLVGYKKFKGSLNDKNTIIFLQIMSKFYIDNEKLYQFVIEHLITNIANLSQSDLTNVICCCNCINKSDLRKFIERFFEILDMNNTELGQQLSRILYSLNKLDQLEFETYIDRILGYLNCIDIRNFEIINVVNMLYSMETIKDSKDKCELISKLVEYIERNFNKFSNQLLASTLGSLTKLNRIDEEIIGKLCENSKALEGYTNSKRDNFKILEFLNNYNYFKETEEHTLVGILESYKVILSNIMGCNDVGSNNGDSSPDTSTNSYSNSKDDIDTNDNKNDGRVSGNRDDVDDIKTQLSSYEEEILQESQNIINMIKCRLDVKSKSVYSEHVFKCRKGFEEIQINV